MAANLPRPEVRLFGAAEENVNSDDDEDDIEDEQLHFAFAGGSTAKEKEKEIVKEKEKVSVPSLSAANSNDAQQRRRRSIELGPGGVPAVFASSGPTAKRAKETAKTQAKRLIGRAEFQSAPMRFPPYARPLEIGSFGLDGQRRMSIGRALLRRFRMPELHVDLEHGFERFVERDPNRPEYLDNLLEFLRFASANETPEARGMRAAKKEKEGSTGKKDEAAAAAAAAACLPMRWEKPFDCDVVCWRGLLTKIMVAASEVRCSLRLAAARIGGSIYLCEFETEEHKAERSSETETQRRTSFAGYRFERFATMPGPDAPPETDEAPVNNNEGFCSVVSAKLGDLRVLLGGEVDCEDDEGQYLELKTCFEHTRHRRGFTLFKSHKWWGQSFLIGIETVVCGLRSKHNHLVKVEKLPCSGMHKMDGQRNWEPAASMQYLLLVLKAIVAEVKQEDTVYVVDWDGDKICFNIREEQGESTHAFFPSWMVAETGHNLAVSVRDKDL